MKKLWRAWQFFREDRLLILGAFGLLLISTWANLLKPWPLAILVDSVLGTRPFPAWLGRWETGADKLALILILGGIVFALHAGQGALSAAQNYVAIKAGLRGLRRVRHAVFSRLQRLSLRFHHGAQSGDMIYRATWDTYAFQTLFQQGLVTFCAAALSLLMMVGVMWRLDRLLTLAALATVPLLLLSIQTFGHKMRVRGAAAQRADSQVAALVQQGIAALPLTQSCTRETLEEERFASQAAVAQERRQAQHGWELLYWLAITVVFATGTAAMVWLGSRRVLAGELTVGELLVFLAYVTQLFDPLNQLSHVGATFMHAGTGVRRVFEVLDAPEEIKEAANPQSIEAGPKPEAPMGKSGGATRASARSPSPAPPLILRGVLQFDRVSFAYEPGQPVLRELSFTLEPGQATAVIGPSGAGKTTLLQLLPRFHDPSEGVVRLDGADLRELRLKDLRQHIALVMQEPLLLPGTIAENIACGRPDASPALIEAAARAAHADVFIEKLPRQYETVVGEGAARLSVGEKQRLNVARAFLKDAPILVLDEPTNALDGESETFVLRSLATLMRGRTTLIVTHRLWTVQQLDRILVLDHGRLVEDGRPEELVGNSAGYYSRMLRQPDSGTAFLARDG